MRMNIRTPGLREEVANALSHGVGFLLAVASLPVLVDFTSRQGSRSSLLGACVFSLTMMLLYFSSAVYHWLPRGRAKDWFNRLDHAAALFGDRPVLMDAAKRGPAGELQVIERAFTREALALALRRGDDDFRLLVDRSLSRLFRSKDVAALYADHFGAPDATALEFFRFVALPD